MLHFDEYVTVRFEPCADFVADAMANQVCAGCGWLSDEHASAGAEVRELPLERVARSRAAA
jgi:hypothetical protein